MCTLLVYFKARKCHLKLYTRHIGSLKEPVTKVVLARATWHTKTISVRVPLATQGIWGITTVPRRPFYHHCMINSSARSFTQGVARLCLFPISIKLFFKGKLGTRQGSNLMHPHNLHAFHYLLPIFFLFHLDGLT